MSQKTAILTDSTADIPKHLREVMDIVVKDAYVHFGNESFTTSNMTLEEFHERASKAKNSAEFPKTSQPSAQDILEGYEELKEKGFTDILSIHLSHKLSGTINSANVAKGMIEGVNIHVIDTGCVSATLLSCLLYARKLIDDGGEASVIAEKIVQFGNLQVGYFSLRTLDNLVKGGRMSPLRYRLGRLLNIKPVLKIYQGEISAHDKARGEEKARELAYQSAIKGRKEDDTFKFIIAHTQSIDQAEKYKKRLLEEFPKAEGHLIEIGMGVGTHTGAGALFFMSYEFPD